MQVAAQIKIRSNPNLYRYLRENSYWYKYLNRSPNTLKALEQEMKERYKLQTKDKMENVANSIKLIQSFLEIMK